MQQLPCKIEPLRGKIGIRVNATYASVRDVCWALVSLENPFRDLHDLPEPDRPARTRPRLKLVETFRQLSAAGGAVARQQGLSSALTFWSKANRDPRALAVWIDFIIGHNLKFTGEIPNARVLRKPQRNYGLLGRPVAERVDALMTHYTFAARRVPASI